ncbi:DUF4396 domain-containing protein [Microbispora bryophytorum]|uniref:DUF4396 domain-containing protein n=1 Tax=Microbispora bryophytorum TaxID=1460882 RepID=UPI003672228A
MVSWIAVAVAAASAVWILVDIYARGHRQRMGIMEAVWPISALYFGPVAVWGYRAWGRPMSDRWQKEHGDPPERPFWTKVAVGVSHCGAGCTVGDIIAETAIFLFGVEIAGRALWAEYAGDYILALALGVVFQYFALAPMRGLGPGRGLVEALKADFLSLTAFEVGLFGWMALMSFVFLPGSPLHPGSPVYWFLMQIGMVIGFFTAWPMNIWLIRRGIKEAM